ncbi:SET domain-containing protein [Actinomadura sp. GC306]|uniref:SET domain-containing protein-lysine N-methyltransferase n=1 Tax=Actinomadura sp. GC306 TaxID=2530367 RepID=UPI00104F0BEF|nr:SET domain-containing protein-lysine N-methyltransferase [Actinomadura sp. GC306]TDC70304.1 SET domain-containing protein [Actinomadura sp. GC306]
MWSGGGYLEVVGGRPGGSGIISNRDFAPGDTIMRVAADLELAEPTRFSLQVGADRHIDAGEIRYLNHSCAPNAYFAASAGLLVAERAIGAGDEVSIFYPASEWDMACPFMCECGADGCVEFVGGARHLPRAALGRYRFNEHVLGLLEALDGLPAHGGRLPAGNADPAAGGDL